VARGGKRGQSLIELEEAKDGLRVCGAIEREGEFPARK